MRSLHWSCMQKKKKNNWKETIWTDESGQSKITIAEIVELLKDEAVVDVQLDELSHIKDLSLHSNRVEKADLSCPIVVIEKGGKYCSILDGHHRRRKALNQKRVFICSKILRICCMPVQFRWLAS